MRARMTFPVVLALLLAGCGTGRPTVPTPDPGPVHTSAPDLPVDNSPTAIPVPDQPVGGSPTESAPGGSMQQGPVYVDQVELVMLESFPVQVRLILHGSLPNPCSKFGWQVKEPDAEGRIQVQAYSLQETDLACIQVLQPMQETIPLGAFTTGSFSVWLNGEQVAEFEL